MVEDKNIIVLILFSFIFSLVENAIKCTQNKGLSMATVCTLSCQFSYTGDFEVGEGFFNRCCHSTSLRKT